MPVLSEGWDQAKTFLLPLCLFCTSLPCSCYLCALVSDLTFSVWDNQRCRNLLVSLLKPPTFSPMQGPGTVELSPAELSCARLGLGSPAAGCSWILTVQPPLPSLGHACFHPCPHPTAQESLLFSLSAFDGSFVFCYLQQAPALPRNLLPLSAAPSIPVYQQHCPMTPGRFHNSLSFGHK